MNKIQKKIGLICLILFMVMSCVTFKQQVLVKPVSNDFPVSASSSTFWNGQIFSSADYTVVGDFEFTAILESPVSGLDTLELDLNDDLAAIMSNSGADGVVDLSFQLLNIKKGPLAMMDISQAIIGMGLVTLGTGLYFQIADNANMQAVFLGGAGASALGLGSYFYAKATGTITYVYKVTGTLVSFRM